MEEHNCRRWLGDLADYLDGQAAAALCAEIERHMAGCENCRVVVDTLRGTIRLYRRQPQPRLSAAARERLYQSLDLAQYLK